jgi:hypothetical protein
MVDLIFSMSDSDDASIKVKAKNKTNETTYNINMPTTIEIDFILKFI